MSPFFPPAGHFLPGPIAALSVSVPVPVVPSPFALRVYWVWLVVALAALVVGPVGVASVVAGLVV